VLPCPDARQAAQWHTHGVMWRGALPAAPFCGDPPSCARDSRCTSGSSPESSQDRRIPHCSKRTHGSALCRAALWSLLPSPCSALSSTQMVSNLLTPSTQDNNAITWHHKPRASRKSWDAGPPPAADTDAQGKSWDIRQPPADFDATYIRPPGLLSTSTKQDPQRWNYNNECG